ncbi:MAG: beta-ketoacyl-[acyl-carrier-protein] synthase family protein [Bacteroidetes bacterium]|nr:beta-ketoacyl-[acyl-carrier-protein] synthase family protein [Bacteroidota bacterium]
MQYSSDRIVVTATGIITSLGRGKNAQIARLRQALPALRHPRILQTKHAAEFVLGEVDAQNETLARSLPFPCPQKLTRTALLTLCALQDLIQLTPEHFLSGLNKKLAFINASTVGGMSEVENHYHKLADPAFSGSETEWIELLDCAESTEYAAAYFGLNPQKATISTACSSSANALLVAARMLKLGLCDAAIAGGGDALSRYTLNGFHSLKNMDHDACRPFDGNRNGLNLGEGAAYLLMERESDAVRRQAPIEAVFSGWCNANDAYHPTAPSPDGSGALRTMKGALHHAGLHPQDIGYINAHGTATRNNDAAEGKAIDTLWQGRPPAFSSTKAFTGHTLAAAGAVEALFSIWAMQEGFIPPNLNWAQTMEESSILPATTPDLLDAAHVMSNSFGFGGNNVSLIFSRP